MNLSALSVELKMETTDCLEGGWIARAWIVEPKVYPRIPMPTMTVFMPERTVVATGSSFVEILRLFVDNTCQALLAHQLGSSGMVASFGNHSTKI